MVGRMTRPFWSLGFSPFSQVLSVDEERMFEMPNVNDLNTNYSDTGSCSKTHVTPSSLDDLCYQDEKSSGNNHRQHLTDDQLKRQQSICDAKSNPSLFYVCEDENDCKVKKLSLGSLWGEITSIYYKYSFLVGCVMSILVAYAYPPMGALYLKPNITASWITVIFVFCKSQIFAQIMFFVVEFRN